MGERIVQEESLTLVADAIRAKGGTSDALSFPTGFADAIAAIEAGGGAPIFTFTVSPESDTTAITCGATKADVYDALGADAGSVLFGFYVRKGGQPTSVGAVFGANMMQPYGSGTPHYYNGSKLTRGSLTGTIQFNKDNILIQAYTSGQFRAGETYIVCVVKAE